MFFKNLFKDMANISLLTFFVGITLVIIGDSVGAETLVFWSFSACLFGIVGYVVTGLLDLFFYFVRAFGGLFSKEPIKQSSVMEVV
jgi:hypothetical protein